MGSAGAISDDRAPVRTRSNAFTLRHVPALDGLRGIAVVGVLFFHGGHLVGGYLGVDLFLVLSGFLITSLLLREADSRGSIGLRGFWERRARRLLPGLFGLLVGVGAYVVFWAKPFEFDSIRAAALASVFYVANWQAIATGHGYWDLFTTPSPLEHTWSLAIEEQFYLVWPLVIYAITRHVRRRDLGASPAATIFVFSVIVALASALWMMIRVVPGEDPSRVYFGTDTRAASILFGAALAAWLAFRGTLQGAVKQRLLEGAAICAALWMAFAWATIDGQSTFLYRGGFTASALAAVVIIAACVHGGGGPIVRFCSLRPLRWLGLISYGLYLWHWPIFLVLQISHARLGLYDWSLFTVQVVVSLLVALASFFILERPIRRRGFSAWGSLGARAMPACAVATVLVLLVVTSGGESRPEFAYQPTAAAGASMAVTIGTVPSVQEEGPVGAPTTTPPRPAETAVVAPKVTLGPIARPKGRSPRLLVVGDSVAHYLGEGIDRQRGLNVQVGNQAMFKCTLGRAFGDWKRQGEAIDYENSECRKWPTIWSDAVTRFKPDAVFMTFGGPPQGALHIGPGSDWYPPCSAQYKTYHRAEVEAAIAVLTVKGATLFIAPSAHPRFPFLSDDIDQRTDCVNSVYRDAAAAHPGVVRILNLDEWTCPPPGKDCVETVDGVTLRDDGIHYRGAAEDVAARWIVTQLFEPL